jgi:type IV secretion system protein VirD4
MIIAVVLLFAFIAGVMSLSNRYNLNNIKNKTVGNGQHGTARWATKREIRNTYKHIDFKPDDWRENPDSRPTEQGIVVGCKNHKGGTTAMVDTGDVHALMIGAAGVGKTAYWLYPCIEYACATGMSFLTTDTKGDLLRNYGTIAEKYYDYKISVIDLRNPTRSNGNNLLQQVLFCCK